MRGYASCNYLLFRRPGCEGDGGDLCWIEEVVCAQGGKRWRQVYREKDKE